MGAVIQFILTCMALYAMIGLLVTIVLSMVGTWQIGVIGARKPSKMEYAIGVTLLFLLLIANWPRALFSIIRRRT